MDNTQKSMPKQQVAKATWQAPTVKEYDATREIKGATLLGPDVLIVGGS